MATSLSSRSKKQINVVFLGDTGVGKSSIINRIHGKDHNKKITTTIGVENSTYQMNVNGKKVSLALHDTAGQEQMKSVTKQYYRECYVAVFVFSGDYPKSLITARNFARPFQLNYMNSKEDESFTPLCICVHNKADLETQLSKSQIDSAVASFSEDFPEFPAYKNMRVFDTSCVTGQGIEDLIRYIGDQLDSKKVFDNLVEDKQTIRLKKSVVDDVDTKKKRSCC